MTLIYISPKDINSVLLKIKERVKVGFVLQELNSLENIVKEASYAYDYRKLFDELGFSQEFEISYKKIDYSPWIRGKSWALQIQGIRNNR